MADRKNGSTANVHCNRRRRLLDRLGDGLLIVPTASHALRNGDVRYEFRPGSDFDYLTGFPEPKAVLFAWRQDGEPHTVLFVRPRDPARETWDGKRFGVLGARRAFGMDEAYPIAELQKRLPKLIGAHRRLFHTLGAHPELDQMIVGAFAAVALSRRRRNPHPNPVIEDPGPRLAAMRQIKTGDEVGLLERAAAISAAGHCIAMRAAAKGKTEFEVQAALEAGFRQLGSERNGYPSIVASGANACILHYTQNRRRMRNGDLLLIDAGAEYAGYTGDITRTFPVSGKFSEAQAAVYRVVLRAQKAGIAAARPGAACDAVHKACVRSLTRGLVELGVLRGNWRKLIEKEAYKPYYMHGTSHWLGRDVHDVGAYIDEDDKPIRFRPGMALTVEPALYFPPRVKGVPKEFRGIGVRIEDDVLITRNGRRVLTSGVPKEIREVEAACASGGHSEPSRQR